MGNKEDKLTKAQKITIGVTIGVAFLAVVLQILVKTWFSPDIRYECGSYYKLQNEAIVSCKLKNYGHKTASLIRIFTKFKSNILEIQISPFTKFNILNGKIGDKELVIEIERIVPSTQVEIFYAVETIQNEPFIERIEYEDSVARTGRPMLWFILSFSLFYALLMFILVLFCDKREKRIIKDFYKNIDEAVKFAHSVKAEGLDQEDIDEIFSKKFREVSFRKETLKKIVDSIINLDG